MLTIRGPSNRFSQIEIQNRSAATSTDSPISNMNKTVKLELTPTEAAVLLMLAGAVSDATPDQSTYMIYEKAKKALGVVGWFRPRSPVLTGNKVTVDKEAVKRLLSGTSFALPELFDFSKFSLPKSVVFFEYPEHGTGKLKPRLLKVETDTASGLAGYEVDLKTGTMSWTYKNFTKDKIQNLQKQ